MTEVQIQPQVPPKTVRIPSRAYQVPTPQLYDLITIGFGTLGLGLAVALQDTDYSRNVLFLEQDPEFLPDVGENRGTHLSTSFAQDLATLRNPTSKFTYLNYLCEIGRLDSVVGPEGSPLPSREEFTKYMCWAARQLSDIVSYGRRVTAVMPVSVGELGVNLWAVTILNVETRTSETLATKNVVFAVDREALIAKVEQNKKIELGDLSQVVEIAKQVCSVPREEVSGNFCFVVLCSGADYYCRLRSRKSYPRWQCIVPRF
jgi:lysine/ornithine N-monooxygenase